MTDQDRTILEIKYDSNKRWAVNHLYDFHLKFNIDPGQYTVKVADPGNSNQALLDVTVDDSTFTGGEFAFYNFSQEDVRYKGFEQIGGSPVPEPSTILLLAPVFLE